MRFVLDASAVLALLQSEPGAEIVREHLPDALISLVNLVEVGTKLVDHGMTAETARELIGFLDIATADFDETLAAAVIGLRSATLGKVLSLGDRACLALALREGAEVLTTDKEWGGLPLDIQIRQIR